MVFPDARVELKIGSVWTDVTTDVMREGGGINYRWGRRSEGSRTEPAVATFDLLNPDGKYASRNPLSPYFGQLGRNTPVRISYDGSDVALVLPPDDLTNATTPDHASLDITGDLDVRADLTPSAWGAATLTGVWEVMGKWEFAGLQQSWLLTVTDDGEPQLAWSTNGIVSITETSSIPVPFAPGQRGAIRATLDVNNGSGGYTVTFYTAATMAGTWTQLGDPVVRTAGTTSIFSSTAILAVGDVSSVGYSNIGLEIHKIEVRNGIAGSAVANPDFTAQPSGTSTFTDAAGRTWTAFNQALTSRRTRAVLEASSWAPRWSSGGQDVITPVEASGILRRLGQGSKALASTLRRRLPGQGPIAYWPMEDARDSAQASSPIMGCPPLPVTGFTFGADDSCPGSAALPSIDAAATMQGPVPAYDSLTNGYLVSLLYTLEAAPASSSPLLAFSTNGTAQGVVVYLTSTGVTVEGYDSTGALAFNNSYAGTLAGAGNWFRVDVSAQANGVNTDFHIGFVDVNGASTAGDFSIAGIPGEVVSIDTAFGALLTGMKLGHLVVFPSSDTSVWGGSDNGYSGEATGARLLRLGTEESLPIAIAVGRGTATAMGAQRPNKLIDLLYECEDADGGILYEDPRRAGLAYRSRDTLYSQSPALTVAYSQLVTPLEPVDDDRYVRNDRTVQRTRGSSARVVQETGVLSVQDPPDGVGTYDDSQTVNVQTDAQLEPLAYWLLHLGTVDEARYPRVRILLHKYPELIPVVAGLKPGDIMRITDLPSFLPPGPVDLLVEGGEEEQRAGEWTITLSCAPGSPWTVATADTSKADTTGSLLGTAATSTATTFVVHTTQTAESTFPLWTQTPAEFPFDLRVGGEVVTASAATTLTADTFTRTVAAGSWGTSSDGHTYTQTGGPTSDRSVAATYGVITLAANPTTHRYMTVSETCQDCDIRAAVAFSAVATGGSLAASIIARWTSFTTYYRLRVEGTTAGGITLSVTRGTTVVGSSVSTGVTYTAGSVIEVRMRVIGDRVLGRAWATGSQEPTSWHIDQTIVSSPITEGQVGLAGSALTGNTNVSPEIRFHDWAIENPQRITVSRSVNDIVKAHTAGAAISLAQPAIAAL